MSKTSIRLGCSGRKPTLASMDVLARLTKVYGHQKWQPRLGPLDELIFTVLTQHTSDSNAEIAYHSMRSIYPTWEDVHEADPGKLVEAIRRGGLANQKAPRIQAILDTILKRLGSLQIDFLRDLPLADAKKWLNTLPGVGPKTTAVVLAFAFGMPAMPVDTHIFRVSRRLGLISTKISVDKAHVVMEGQVNPKHIFEYHVLLIKHGRHICKAQRPSCQRCALGEICHSRIIFQRAFDQPIYRRPIRNRKLL